jgi:uncharacterized membrane protein YjgN (DUF898 family)
MLNDPPAHSMALPAGYDVPGQPLNWGGQGGRIASIFFANLVLSILTLGIYRFWGIVRMRRYVWTHLAPLGDRLEYAGTGGELLRGFLVVMIMLVPLWLLGIGGEFLSVLHPWLTVAVPATQFAILVFLLAAGRHAARRFLASRTIWRGIRLVVILVAVVAPRRRHCLLGPHRARPSRAGGRGRGACGRAGARATAHAAHATTRDLG